MIFENGKIYDILKYLALIGFNAVGVFYKAISGIWHLPYGDEVALTCSALALFVGTLIGISSHQYNKIIEEFENEKVTDHEVFEED